MRRLHQQPQFICYRIAASNHSGIGRYKADDRLPTYGRIKIEPD
jgi:hypothetical protein